MAKLRDTADDSQDPDNVPLATALEWVPDLLRGRPKGDRNNWRTRGVSWKVLALILRDRLAASGLLAAVPPPYAVLYRDMETTKIPEDYRERCLRLAVRLAKIRRKSADVFWLLERQVALWEKHLKVPTDERFEPYRRRKSEEE